MPLPYSGQNFMVFPLDYIPDVGSAKGKHQNGEIILEEFQPM